MPVLTLCILVVFPICIDIISMGLPIVCVKGSQIKFDTKYGPAQWYFKGSQIEFAAKYGTAHCVL